MLLKVLYFGGIRKGALIGQAGALNLWSGVGERMSEAPDCDSHRAGVGEHGRCKIQLSSKPELS